MFLHWSWRKKVQIAKIRPQITTTPRDWNRAKITTRLIKINNKHHHQITQSIYPTWSAVVAQVSQTRRQKPPRLSGNRVSWSILKSRTVAFHDSYLKHSRSIDRRHAPRLNSQKGQVKLIIHIKQNSQITTTRITTSSWSPTRGRMMTNSTCNRVEAHRQTQRQLTAWTHRSSNHQWNRNKKFWTASTTISQSNQRRTIVRHAVNRETNNCRMT